jgi:hypothetical protein
MQGIGAGAQFDLAGFGADGTQITLIGGGVPVAYFLANEASLDTLADGFGISDTAQNVASALDALDADSHLTSIDLTDGGTPTIAVSIEQALNDVSALGKIDRAHTIAISDSSADIAALTSAQAAQLGTAGYQQISATAPATLSLDEALTLSGDGDRLSPLAARQGRLRGDEGAMTPPAAGLAYLKSLSGRNLQRTCAQWGERIFVPFCAQFVPRNFYQQLAFSGGIWIYCNPL